MLASLRGDSDADDLAGTALEDQEVAHADEVAWDGDGVGRVSTAGTDNANSLADAVTDAGGTTLVSDNLILVLKGMEDAVSSALNSTAEGVVVAVVVVVTHLARRLFDNCLTVDVDFDVGLKTSSGTSVGYFAGAGTSVDGLDWFVSLVVRVVDVVDLAVVLDLVLWVGAATVFTFSDVELSLDWGSASLVESEMLSALNTPSGRTFKFNHKVLD